MTYSEARREVRKLLRSDKGEVQELKGAHVLAYSCLAGIMQGKKFVPLAAGMNWAEAVGELKKRLASAKEDTKP